MTVTCLSYLRLGCTICANFILHCHLFIRQSLSSTVVVHGWGYSAVFPLVLTSVAVCGWAASVWLQSAIVWCWGLHSCCQLPLTLCVCWLCFWEFFHHVKDTDDKEVATFDPKQQAMWWAGRVRRQKREMLRLALGVEVMVDGKKYTIVTHGCCLWF